MFSLYIKMLTEYYQKQQTFKEGQLNIYTIILQCKNKEWLPQVTWRGEDFLNFYFVE